MSKTANGNQTTAGATTYTYDLADRLTTATLGSTSETYTYAGDRTRLSAATGALPADTIRRKGPRFNGSRGSTRRKR